MNFDLESTVAPFLLVDLFSRTAKSKIINMCMDFKSIPCKKQQNVKYSHNIVSKKTALWEAQELGSCHCKRDNCLF